MERGSVRMNLPFFFPAGRQQEAERREAKGRDYADRFDEAFARRCDLIPRAGPWERDIQRRQRLIRSRFGGIA